MAVYATRRELVVYAMHVVHVLILLTVYVEIELLKCVANMS